MRNELREILGELAGRASMCWSETPKGIFESSEANKAVDEAFVKIKENYIRKEELPDKKWLTDFLYVRLSHLQIHTRKSFCADIADVLCKRIGR